MDNSLYRSDIQELIKEVGSSRGANPDDTLEKCKKLLEYGEGRRDDALIGFAHFSMGETYYLLNDMASFYLEMLKCMKPFQKIREWGYLAAAYNMLGIMALNRGNAPMAMDYYYKALEYCNSYKLPELKCTVHMNIASLYLSVGNGDDAIVHLDEARKYVMSHPDMENRTSCLNAILLGKGKAYLLSKDVDNAKLVIPEIESKCLPEISDTEKLAVDCFMARTCAIAGEEAHCRSLIAKISGTFNSNIPVMDYFDDIYDYLKMLLETGEYVGFINMYDSFLYVVRQTMIKNLEKKMLELKLEYLKINNQMNDYHKLSEEYIEILKAMDTENSLMVSSMLSLRSNFHKLKEENEEEKKNSRFLKRKSETDPLTGMSNRLKLNEYAEIAFDRAITNGVAFAIELLDIDYFKEYNDNYGHQAGDECLLFIAKAIESLSKNHMGVSCYRYGGDEFVIIYESFTEQEVFDIAKELKNNIVGEKKEHAYSKGEIKLVTISQGIYWGAPKESDKIWEFLQEADHLLYKVKQKSRNSIMLGKSKSEEAHHGDGTASKPLVTELTEEEYRPADD